MTEKISTGSRVMDELLEGGLENDTITTIYGPAGSGKTCFCILSAAAVCRSGKKVIYIDTEGGFSIERMKQVAPDYRKIVKNLVFLKPINFNEQKKSFSKLRKLVNDNIGLVVVDTISMLYRVELGKTDEVYEINKALGVQLSYLSELARKKEIPVLLTNQVYSNFDGGDGVSMVGGDIMKYSSKCLVELQNFKSFRKAILRKHRSVGGQKEADFKIVEKGFEKIKRTII